MRLPVMNREDDLDAEKLAPERQRQVGDMGRVEDDRPRPLPEQHGKHVDREQAVDEEEGAEARSR
ncbi:hypothetical protein D3C87_926440 [compost metagenome]